MGTKSAPVYYTDKTADLSACHEYRFSLTRSWDATPLAPGQRPGRRCLFVMLNPSTADAMEDDPTIRRCVGFARSWGFTLLHVVNLFAYRATVPADLYNRADPVGQNNDGWILDAARAADQVVCAWGAHGGYRSRGNEVASLLRGEGIALFCLGETDEGHPRHPLYLKADLRPVPYIRTAESD